LHCTSLPHAVASGGTVIAAVGITLTTAVAYVHFVRTHEQTYKLQAATAAAAYFNAKVISRTALRPRSHHLRE